MPVRYLFIDMNSFFASVEQQHDPKLRGRPVIVVPTDTDATSCIAASYEAKRYGIKTGTPVWEARKMCPGVVRVVAQHKLYVMMHERIVEAVASVTPIDRIMSIDEMSCKLTGGERSAERARDISARVKRAIRETAGDYMSCSIGGGPSTLLAKVAADMEKPDGLTVLGDADIPGALHRLKLNDFPGVGPRMERRLNLHGIFKVEQFCQMSAKALSDVWGSKILGERWFRILRGEDVIDKVGRRQTVSHSHVLPPDLRTDEKAFGVLVRLTHKAAARLRKIGYWAGGVSVGVRYKDGGGWDSGCRFPCCQDTLTVLQELGELWKRRPADGGVPFKIGMVLFDLVPARSATPSLFDYDRKMTELSHAMDGVNREFGTNVVYFGTMWGMADHAPNRIAFTQIPDFDRRVS